MKHKNFPIGNAVRYNATLARKILTPGKISLKSFENFGKSDKVGSPLPLGFTPQPKYEKQL